MIRILFLFMLIHYALPIIAISNDSIKRTLDSLKNKSISKELLAEHEALYDYAVEIQYEEGKYRIKKWIGNYYFNLGNFAEATEIFLEAYEMSEIQNDPIISADAMNSLGRVYFIIGDLEKAMESYKAVISIGEDIGEEELIAEASAGLAHCLAELDRYDEAIDRLKIQQNYNRKEGKAKNLLIANYNMACYELKRGFPELAMETGQDYLEHYRQSLDSFEMSFGYSLIGASYLGMNEADLALIFLDSALLFSEALDIKSLSLDLYEEKTNAYALKGDYKQALLVQREYSRRNKEIYKESMKGNLALLELNSLAIKKEEKLIESQLQINELHTKQQKLYLIVGAVLGSLIIVVLFFRKKKQDFLKSKSISDMRNELIESELKLKDLKASKLEEQLESKQADLTNFALDIARKNEFSNELINRLTALEKSLGSVNGLREIINFSIKHLQVSKELAILQNNVQQINNEFYKKMEALYGDLTNNEKYMAGLLRLNLSNKDIASIKGISTNSVKVSRHRLRKRLNLDSEIDIVRYLQEI